MSQVRLAAALTLTLGREIDKAAVNKMVSGKRAISGDEIIAIQAIFEIKLPTLSVNENWLGSFPDEALPEISGKLKDAHCRELHIAALTEAAKIVLAEAASDMLTRGTREALEDAAGMIFNRIAEIEEA